MKQLTETDINLEIALRKKVEKEFLRLCSLTYQGASTVFDDFLEYIVHGFSLKGEPMKGWKYTPEQTREFGQMLHTLVESMDEILKSRSWYDFLGGIYETQVAGKERKSNSGQFFTPMNVCELCAALTAPQEGQKGKTICDPCSGSGRMLLAGYVHNPEAVLVAADIDRTCCLMTCVNFLLHGCTARVSHGDSLKGTEWEVWLVNPDIRNAKSPLCGIPHIFKPVAEKAA